MVKGAGLRLFLQQGRQLKGKNKSNNKEPAIRSSNKRKQKERLEDMSISGGEVSKSDLPKMIDVNNANPKCRTKKKYSHLEIHVAATAAGTDGAFDPEHSVPASVLDGELPGKRRTEAPLLVNAADQGAGRAEHLHALGGRWR